MTSPRKCDPFFDRASKPRKLLGVSLASGSCRIAELAGRIGYDIVWIDVEHGAVPSSEVETLCLAVEAGGASPAVRIASGERENVLHALEAGADLVIVPMINTAREARQVVEFGKFAPLGKRGFNTRSRGVGFGLAGPSEGFRLANERTHLIAQIETVQAVENVKSICEVDGVSGILVGPGDLSQDMGRSAQFDDPDLVRAVVTCIEQSRALGKHAGIFTSSPTLLDAGTKAGCDFAFVTIDLGDLAQLWSSKYAELSKRFCHGDTVS